MCVVQHGKHPPYTIDVVMTLFNIVVGIKIHERPENS